MTEEFESHSWRPTAGDEITGKLISVEARESGYGPYPMLALDVDGSEVSVHAFHTVLRTELAKRRPKPGDELTIKYLGKTPDSKDRKGYHSYRVLGGQPMNYDWSRDLPDGFASAEPESEPDVDVPIATDDLPDPVPVPDDDDLPF